MTEIVMLGILILGVGILLYVGLWNHSKSIDRLADILEKYLDKQ